MDEPQLIEKVKVGAFEGQVIQWGGKYFAQVRNCEPIDAHGPAFERCVEMVEQVASPDDFKNAKGRIDRQIELFKERVRG